MMRERLVISNQVEEKEKFKCEKCGKEFSHMSTCSQHKLTCGNGKSFDCKGCNKTFDRNDSLARPSEAGVQAGKSGGTCLPNQQEIVPNKVAPSSSQDIM